MKTLILILVLIVGLYEKALSQELVYVDNDSSTIFIDSPLIVGNDMQLSTFFYADLTADLLVVKIFRPIKCSYNDSIAITFVTGEVYKSKAIDEFESENGEAYFKMTFELYNLLSTQAINSIKYKVFDSNIVIDSKLSEMNSFYFLTVFDQLMYIKPRSLTDN